eukprot:14919-Heterococcus_DN1.PRE.7
MLHAIFSATCSMFTQQRLARNSRGHRALCMAKVNLAMHSATAQHCNLQTLMATLQLTVVLLMRVDTSSKTVVQIS